MLLTDHQIAIVQDQTGVTPLPADDAFTHALSRLYGVHTFYLTQDGLSYIEKFAEILTDHDPARFVRIAEWADPSRTRLQKIEPEAQPCAVDFKTPAD